LQDNGAMKFMKSKPFPLTLTLAMSQDVLRQIRDAARTMQQAAPSDFSNIKTTPPPATWYSISPANSIHLRLVELGLPSAIAEELSSAFLKMSAQLRLACESSLQRAIQDLASKELLVVEHVGAMREVWIATYEQQTKAWADSAISRARNYVLSACAVPCKRPSFNHVSSPIHDAPLIDFHYRNIPPFWRNISNTMLIHLHLIGLFWQGSQ